MRSRPRLTYSNVMVTLLALVVLFGGGAYAASRLGKNSVGTKQLKRSAVTSAKVKDATLRGRDLASGVVPATSHGFQASGSVNYDTFSSSPFGSTVVTLDVPAGAYLAIAAVEPQTVNPVATDVTCRLTDGSSVTTRTQIVRTDTEPENFTLTALFDVGPGEPLRLQCSKADAGAAARIVTANIVAVRISDAQGTTD